MMSLSLGITVTCCFISSPYLHEVHQKVQGHIRLERRLGTRETGGAMRMVRSGSGERMAV